MRLLVLADLHYDNPRSRGANAALLERVAAESFDVLLVIGDVGNGDEDWLEKGLSAIAFDGPRLFVPGNHELWTRRGASLPLLNEELPRRVRSLGWRWLPGEPFTEAGLAIVGSLGWYDYRFAAGHLQIPRRFYEAKLSPGAALALHSHPELFERQDDITPAARELVARWNDGKFVHLPMSDERFCDLLLDQLDRDLQRSASATSVVVAIHHLPIAELLPPVRAATWDFGLAYLGSPRFGELIAQRRNVSHVYCGHSHFPAHATLGRTHFVNVGSGYREKRYELLEIG
jgi:predicted phosphodiesterase